MTVSLAHEHRLRLEYQKKFVILALVARTHGATIAVLKGIAARDACPAQERPAWRHFRKIASRAAMCSGTQAAALWVLATSARMTIIGWVQSLTEQPCDKREDDRVGWVQRFTGQQRLYRSEDDRKIKSKP